VATAAELLVVNLVPQHDPEPNPQLPCRRHASFCDALLDELAAVEAVQFGILSNRVQGGFTPEKP
jgi:hypothetical protein